MSVNFYQQSSSHTWKKGLKHWQCKNAQQIKHPINYDTAPSKFDKSQLLEIQHYNMDVSEKKTIIFYVIVSQAYNNHWSLR